MSTSLTVQTKKPVLEICGSARGAIGYSILTAPKSVLELNLPMTDLGLHQLQERNEARRQLAIGYLKLARMYFKDKPVFRS